MIGSTGDDSLIVVTGANGALGRAVVERLLDRFPTAPIGASVRSPGEATKLLDRGARVRRGDFDDPSSLACAFADAARVLIVSVDASGDNAIRQHRAAIHAARTAGVRRILYTSHQGANPTSAFAPMRDHAATETALRELGVPFTALRNGFYMTSALQLIGPALETGELVAPEDGPVAWTSHADLAEAAVTALTGAELDGATPALTGSEAIDMSGIAAIVSELVGHSIRRVVVPDAEYRDGLMGHGVPEQNADHLVDLFVASRGGDFSSVDPTLARMLDRPPVTLRDMLAAALTTGQHPAA